MTFTLQTDDPNGAQDVVQVSCDGTVVVSCGSESSWVMIQQGSPVTITVNYTVTGNSTTTPGSIDVSFTDQWTGETGNGSAEVTLQSSKPSLSANPTTQYTGENVSTNYPSFTLTNSGDTPATYTASVTCSGTASSCSVRAQPPSEMAPGASTTLIVDYQSYFASAGNGTITLHVTSQFSESASSTVTIVPLSDAVLVTPDGQGSTVQYNSSTTLPFVLHETGNSGSGFNYTLTVSCGSGVVSCTFANGSTQTTVPPNPGADQSVPVTIRTINSLAGGSGTVTVTASVTDGWGHIYQDQGSFNVTVPDARTYTVGVTAPSGTTDYFAEQANTSYTFTVTNSGNTQATYTLSVPTCSGTASGCSPSQGSVTLVPGASANIPVSFTTLAAGQNGSVALRATYGSTSATSAAVAIVPLSEAVSVTPDGETATLGVNGTVQVPFTIHETGNAGSGFNYTLTASCSGSIVGCTFVSTGTQTMTVPPGPGIDQTVQVWLTGTSSFAGGYGAVSVTATYNNGINPPYHDEGSYGTTIPDARTDSVRVTPDGATGWNEQNAPASYTFTIQNHGNSPATYAVSIPVCTGAAVTCSFSSTAASTSTSLTLGNGASADVPVYLTMGAPNQAVDITLRATGKTTDDGSVHLIPQSAADTLIAGLPQITAQAGSTGQATWGLLDIGQATPVTYTVDVTCTAPVISCTLPNGTQTQQFRAATDTGASVAVGYAVQTKAQNPLGGQGAIQVHAYVKYYHTYESYSASVVTVPQSGTFGVTVTPDTARVGVAANGTALVPFHLVNTGNMQATYGLSVSCVGVQVSASSCAVPSQSVTLDSAGSADVQIPAILAAGGNKGSVTLRATNTISVTATDTGFTSIIDTTALIVTLRDSSQVHDRSLCVTSAIVRSVAYECGDLRVAHPLMAIRTVGKSRAPTLIYNSQVANPHPVISADVTIPRGAAPTTVIATLKGAQGQPYDSVQWPAWSPGTTKRIALTFDASSYATNIYPYTLTVIQVASGGSRSSSTSGAFVVVNRAASNPSEKSAFGSGWWLAGVERLYVFGVDTLLWVDGDGSTRIYTRSPSAAAYTTLNVAERDSITATGSGYTRWAPHGLQVQFDGFGNHIHTVNRLGQTTTFTWVNNQLQSISVPSGTASESYALNYVNGWLNTAITPGVLPAGRVTTINTDQTTGRISSIIDPNADGTLGVRFTYDGSSSRIQSRTDRINNLTTFGYDAAARLAADTTPITGHPAIVRSYRSAETAALAGPSDSVDVLTLINGPRKDTTVTRIWSGALGQSVRVVNALGDTTKIRYDGRWPGLPAQVTNAVGHSTYATYDTTTGNVLAVADSAPYKDGRIATTRYEWDPTWGFVSKIVNPERDSVTFGYDPATGNRLWMQPGSSSQRRVNFLYSNSFNELSDVIVPAEGTTKFAYDPARGNLSQVTTPLGYQTHYYQDDAGHDTLVVSPVDSSDLTASNTGTRLTVRHLFNQNDVEWETVSAGGGDTTIVRRFLNKELLPDSTSTWTRPALNTDVLTTRWTYDNALRTITEKTPDMNVQYFGYDAAGNQTSWTTRRGITITSMYDSLNRLVDRVGGADGPSHFEYDSVGHMTEAWNTAARVSRRYFPNGALRSDTLRTNVLNGNDFTAHVYGLGYAYDLDGRRDSLMVPDALTPPDPFRGANRAALTYTYDPETGALNTVADLDYNTATYTDDDAGRLASLTRGQTGSQVAESWHYDADGRMIWRHETSPGTSAFDYTGRTPMAGLAHEDSLQYDARGKVVIARTLVDTTKITYRSLGPVSHNFHMTRSPALADASEDYVVDGVGQIASKSNPSEDPTSFTYERTTGRLISSVGAVQDTNTYDPSGNIVWTNRYWNPPMLSTSDQCGLDGCNPVKINDVYTYSYSGDEKLTGVSHTSAATNMIENGAAVYSYDYWDSSDDYRYDALGRRVLMTSTGYATGSNSVQRFVWDGDQLLYEIHYPYGGGIPDAESEYDTVTVTHPRQCGPNTYPCGLAPGDPGWPPDTVTYDGGAGRVLYVYGRELDAPVSIIRYGYGTGTSLYPVFSIVPRRDWRGFYDGGITDGPAGVPDWPEKNTRLYHLQVSTTNYHGWFGNVIRSQRDPSGLFYRRNRYYEPLQGRFTQEDPIGLAGGLNAYGFGGGDPVNYSDPFGLCVDGDWKCELAKALSEVTGFVAGFLHGGSEGGAAGLFCGPAAEVCSPAAALAGGIGEGTVAGAAAGKAVDSYYSGVNAMSRRNGRSGGHNRQKLSSGEITKLKKAGLDPEEIKEFDGKADLFKDQEGDIYVHPKDGSGPGEPTGYNIHNLPKPPNS